MPRAGTYPASDVRRAVVKAIREGRAEMVVMPGSSLLLKALMDRFPSLGESATTCWSA